MLPHGTILGMANSNMPSLHVVGIPAWNVYQRFETQGVSTKEHAEYQPDDAAEYFKAMAERNGIKVSNPAGETSADLSPAASEFVPRPAEITQPQTLALLAAPSSSSTLDTSPANEDSKLLQMFQEVLNEKKQQMKVLTECMKNRQESESTISSLKATKTALDKEIEALYQA